MALLFAHAIWPFIIWTGSFPAVLRNHFAREHRSAFGAFLDKGESLSYYLADNSEQARLVWKDRYR